MSDTPKGPRLPIRDGFRPTLGVAVPNPRDISTNGFKPNPQSGYVAPTQSAPPNPPSGGSSGKPGSGSK